MLPIASTKTNKLNKTDKILYIVDKRQKLHFEQLFDSIKYFQFGEEEYTHVEFGTVNDLNGNPFKTRDGDTNVLETANSNAGQNLTNSLNVDITNTEFKNSFSQAF